MGVGKDWRNHNLALLHHRKHRNKQLFFWKWCFLAPARRLIRWTLVCGVLLFVLGLVSLCIGHVVSDLDRYSHRIVNRSWYYKMNGAHAPVDIWKSEFSKFYYGCSERGPRFTPLGLSDIQVLQVVHSPHLFSQSIQSFTDSTGNILAAVRERSSNGYLLIAASGGLNQQRTGITDAVVVSWILNATLVVPELDHNSFWKDDSDFIDIFDVDWFISSLSKDVTIVKRVPDKVMRSMLKPPYTMRVPRKSEPDYYLEEVLPILLRRHVVQLTKFDYRLANDLDEELQKLRCRVNYHALKFTEPISGIGQLIVLRMRKRARRFISVHLRFEPDMLAFSGCYFGGGDKERYELGEIRKRWTTLPETTPNEERKRGKCPLTPHEVGLMLRALGYNNDSLLYVASGDIYGGEETLRPLRELFPNFYTKEMLAGEELQPFLSFSSRLAAIDYIVCEDSDVFVTNNNGNMAKILAGRRRYIGHKRTIRPNAKRLSALFMARDQMDWDTFAEKVKSCQRGFMGDPEEMRPGRGEFHEYPASCICKRPLKYFHVQNNYDGNGSSRTVPILDTKAEYGDHQSTITMQGINNSKLHEVPVSSTEADDDDEFLGD